MRFSFRKTTVIAAFLAALITLSSCASQPSETKAGSKGDSDVASSQSGNRSATDSKTDSNPSTGDLLTDIGVRPDILAAIDASDSLGWESLYLTDDNNIHYVKGTVRDGKLYEAYACFGKKIKRLFAPYGNPLILTDDNKLYYGGTLISEDLDIRRAVRKDYYTKGKENGEYMLSSDGRVFRYLDESGVFEQMGDEGGFTSILVSKDYALVFGTDTVTTPGSLKSGSSYSSSKSFYDWKNIAVVAGAHGKSDWKTVAGIDKDGKVFADGDYADEILAMGDLSYIAMDQGGTLIVGLTTQGTLKFAGIGAKDVPDNVKNLSDITGIVMAGKEEKWCEAELVMRDKSGNIHFWDSTRRTYRLNPADGYLDESGNIYAKQGDDGTYAVETNYPKADASNTLNLMTYCEFVKDTLKGRDQVKNAKEFMTVDFDNNGAKEVVLRNKQGRISVVSAYDCSAGIRLEDMMIAGYYPNSGLIKSMGGGSATVTTYTAFNKGNMNPLASMSSWHGDKSFTYFGDANDLPYREEAGDALRKQAGSVNESVLLTETEFNKLIESVTNGETMVEFKEDYIEYNEENLREALGIPAYQN